MCVFVASNLSDSELFKFIAQISARRLTIIIQIQIQIQIQRNTIKHTLRHSYDILYALAAYEGCS